MRSTGSPSPASSPGGERALGLGLPLAKQFVEAHGGTIALVSRAGRGDAGDDRAAAAVMASSSDLPGTRRGVSPDRRLSDARRSARRSAEVVVGPATSSRCTATSARARPASRAGCSRRSGLPARRRRPSFAIVQPYAPPEVRLPVLHVDLYRIDDAGEIEELGLDEARARFGAAGRMAGACAAGLPGPMRWR